MTFDHTPVKSMHMWIYPRIIMSESKEKTSLTIQKGQYSKWPQMNFDPTSVRVTCLTLPKDHKVQLPWKYIKVCGYSDHFSENFNHKVNDS